LHFSISIDEKLFSQDDKYKKKLKDEMIKNYIKTIEELQKGPGYIKSSWFLNLWGGESDNVK
jgi:hypothetical protein